MGLTSLAAKVVRAGADLGAGLGTHLAAAAIDRGAWQLASACLGVSALCIAAKTAIETHGEEKTRQKIEVRYGNSRGEGLSFPIIYRSRMNQSFKNS